MRQKIQDDLKTPVLFAEKDKQVTTTEVREHFATQSGEHSVRHGAKALSSPHKEPNYRATQPVRLSVLSHC